MDRKDDSVDLVVRFIEDSLRHVPSAERRGIEVELVALVEQGVEMRLKRYPKEGRNVATRAVLAEFGPPTELRETFLGAGDTHSRADLKIFEYKRSLMIGISLAIFIHIAIALGSQPMRLAGLLWQLAGSVVIVIGLTTLVFSAINYLSRRFPHALKRAGTEQGRSAFVVMTLAIGASLLITIQLLQLHARQLVSDVGAAVLIASVVAYFSMAAAVKLTNVSQSALGRNLIVICNVSIAVSLAYLFYRHRPAVFLVDFIGDEGLRGALSVVVNLLPVCFAVSAIWEIFHFSDEARIRRLRDKVKRANEVV